MARFVSFGPGNRRDLEVHEGVMADVDDQVCGTTYRDGCFRGVRAYRKFFFISPGGGRKKIAYGRFDLASFVGIRNQEDILLAVLENAAFENRSSRRATGRDEFPFLAGFEERFEAISCTPIEVALRIVSVAKSGWDRDDSLVLLSARATKTCTVRGAAAATPGTSGNNKARTVNGR